MNTTINLAQIVFSGFLLETFAAKWQIAVIKIPAEN